MEVAAAILGIILVALDIFTAIHAWKKFPVSKWIKVLSCIAILFLGWVAMIAYWLIYFLIIKKNNSTVQHGTTLTSHAPIDTTVNSFNPPEENNDEDEKTMQSLFNEAMNGPEGKKLAKSYEELMNIFIMKPNGECKGTVYFPHWGIILKCTKLGGPYSTQMFSTACKAARTANRLLC